MISNDLFFTKEQKNYLKAKYNNYLYMPMNEFLTDSIEKTLNSIFEKL